MFNDHRCYVDEEGVEWPRLGAILGILDKPQLVDWAARQGADAAIKGMTKINGGLDAPNAKLFAIETWRDTSAEAMSIGSEVHEMISQHIGAAIRGEAIDFSGKYRPEVEAGVVAFYEWEKEHVARWVATEVACIDTIELGYGCTVDAVAVMKDGSRLLIDFKTSRAIYDEYKIQAVAGMMAWNGVQPDEHATGCGILRLDKETGLPEWKEVDDVPRWAAVFTTMATLFYQIKKRRLAGNPFVERYFPTTTKKGKSKKKD